MNKETIFKQQDFHGTRNGIEIEMHLEKCYEDFILKTFETKGKPIESEKLEEQTIPCGGCGSLKIHIVWDRNYSGYRGNCIICKNNWPES